MNPDLTITYEREADGRWIGAVDALPGCMVYGASQAEARRDVIALALDIVRDSVEHDEWGPDLPTIRFAEAR